MKFKCNQCGAVVKRDMRTAFNKSEMTKRGYKSYCERVSKYVFLKPIK